MIYIGAELEGGKFYVKMYNVYFFLAADIILISNVYLLYNT